MEKTRSGGGVDGRVCVGLNPYKDIGSSMPIINCSRYCNENWGKQKYKMGCVLTIVNIGGLEVLIVRKNRCGLEIIADILSIAKNDVKKTRLLYQANLGYSNFIKYSEFLLEKEFLGVKTGNHSGKIYYTTEKGKKLLEDIKHVHRQLV